MASLYIKSLAYIGIFGGIGYLLMKFTEPSEEKRRAILGSKSVETESEVRNRTELFLKKLKEPSSSDTPIILQNKSEAKPGKREIN